MWSIRGRTPHNFLSEDRPHFAISMSDSTDHMGAEFVLECVERSKERLTNAGEDYRPGEAGKTNSAVVEARLTRRERGISSKSVAG